MRLSLLLPGFFLLSCLLSSSQEVKDIYESYRQPDLLQNVWAGDAPGEPDGFTPKPESADKRGVVRVSHVSTPTFGVYKPETPNGAAVIVCPGGGYGILAFEHEGTEVCRWLNSLGVTGVILKYRVPRRHGSENPQPTALADARRTVRLVRHHAKDWGVDPTRVGMLGFSAGGNLVVHTALLGDDQDKPSDPKLAGFSGRPDFLIPIYPAYLTKEKNKVEPAENLKVDDSFPPTFVAVSKDDSWANSSFALCSELARAGVSHQLVVSPKGGHGWGITREGTPADTWPGQCAAWMKGQGFLSAK